MGRSVGGGAGWGGEWGGRGGQRLFEAIQLPVELLAQVDRRLEGLVVDKLRLLAQLLVEDALDGALDVVEQLLLVGQARRARERTQWEEACAVL